MVSDMKKENNLNKIIGDDVSLMGKKEHVKILEVDKLYKSNDFVDPEVVDKTEKICYAMASSGAWAIFSKRRHADSMLTELQSGAISDANKKSVKGIILECKNVYAATYALGRFERTEPALKCSEIYGRQETVTPYAAVVNGITKFLDEEQEVSCVVETTDTCLAKIKAYILCRSNGHFKLFKKRASADKYLKRLKYEPEPKPITSYESELNKTMSGNKPGDISGYGLQLEQELSDIEK